MAGQALSDNKRITPECVKKFAQHLRLFSVLRHPIHFSL